MALKLVRSIVSEMTVEYSAGRRDCWRAIHVRALRHANEFRASEANVINSLREVDDFEVYSKFKLSSLYQYAVQILKLSEDVACDLIAIMRKSRAIPELAEKIRDGSITASKARKILSVVTPENKNAWLELAATQSSRMIEKAVATANPKEAVKESVRYKTAERLEFTIGVGEGWLALLKDVKDLLSQERGCAVSSEDALQFVMRDFVNRRDPLCRAQRAQHRAQRKETNRAEKPRDLSVPGRINARERLNAATKNSVLLRDQRQCRFIHANGVRCDHRRWLDVHHVNPVANGGTNAIENLVTLCTAHHRQMHAH